MSKSKNPHASYFTLLSEDCIEKIFLYLSPQDVCRLEKTNSFFRAIGERNTIWKIFFTREFPSEKSTNLQDHVVWKELYKNISTFPPALSNLINNLTIRNCHLEEGIFRIEGNKTESAEIVNGILQNNLWIPKAEVVRKASRAKDDMMTASKEETKKTKKVHFHFFKKNKESDEKKEEKKEKKEKKEKGKKSSSKRTQSVDLTGDKLLQNPIHVSLKPLSSYHTHSIASALKDLLQNHIPIRYQFKNENLAPILLSEVKTWTDEKIKSEFLLKLPVGTYAMLKKLIPFLYFISKHSSKNLMTVENLAMTFAFSLSSPGLNVIPDLFQQNDKLTRLWTKLIEMKRV